MKSLSVHYHQHTNKHEHRSTIAYILVVVTFDNIKIFSFLNRNTHWCYADYKYMHILFKDYPDVLSEIDWGVFGFDGRNGSQSTIWIGSNGAYTHCHQDSYGFNLIAQITGSKRWVLFPPKESHRLYPTRIPYEESSIFSKVNIKTPDLKLHPKFASVRRIEVCIVILI